MSYVLAIDVGTSFTAAAVARFNQEASPVPESLPLGLRGAAVPSVVYFAEDGTILVGEAAERRGLDFPERVVREFKRRVGDAVPIAVGTLSLAPEDVFATMAGWVVDRASEREGAAPSDIILTYPAAWGSHRIGMVKGALAAKGLQDVTLITEPEAAALHYASQVRVEDGSTIAVYDLGGGTFDTAVLRKAGSSRFELVGRPEGIENLGGADFDAAVFRYVVENTGSALQGLDPTQPGVLAALARLKRECIEAKEALSSDSETTIAVFLPGVQQQVRLVRSEFEALIEEPIRDTVEALEQSLAQLRLEPADLSAVLLIGGSSRIPLVAQLISEQLDRPIAVDADPKSSICLGAAAAAVLARQAAVQAPAPAASAVAGFDGSPPEHVPPRLASWSRKGTTASGASAAAAAHGSHERGGAHAPKPSVRVTAVAAAAAILTVLTATAAQSPEGFGNFASVLLPRAGASSGDEAPAGGAGGSGGTGQAAAGTGAAQEPLAGIEAGVQRNADPDGDGLSMEASPTSRPSSGAAAQSDGDGSSTVAGGTPAGAPAAGAGTGTGTAPGAATGTDVDATGGGTDTSAPGTGATSSENPTTMPSTQEPAPVNTEPSTGTQEPGPVTQTPTQEPTPTQDPDPVTEQPSPVPETSPSSTTAEPAPMTETAPSATDTPDMTETATATEEAA